MNGVINKREKWFIALIIVAMVAVAGRIALPYVIKSYINHRLENIPNYRGHVDGLSVSLWRGAYQLEDVTVRQLNSATHEPLFSAASIDISVFWRALFHGLVVAEIVAYDPKINFAAGHAGKAVQTGKGVDWTAIVGDITPMRIDRLEVVNGELHYYDHFSYPSVNVYLSRIQATLTDLVSRDNLANHRPSHLVLSAKAMDRSDFFTDVVFNPFEKKPDFKLKLKLTKFPMTALREFMHAYTPVDPSSGTLDLVVETTASNGNMEGYVKPLLHDLKLDNWKPASDPDHHPLRYLSNKIGEAINFIFRNQAKDQLASKVPFSGKIDDPDVGVFSAIMSVFRNAFVNAFEPKFEPASRPRNP